MTSSKYILGTGLVLSIAGKPLAQTPELEPIYSSSHRYALIEADVSSSVALLDAEDFELYPAETIANTLSRLPGINAAGNGATGSNTSLFVRGTESDHILFIVDGIRISDSNTAYQNRIGGLPIGNIGAVEVSRGPHSLVYGSDAIGGVVAITSRKGTGEVSESVTGLVGSFDTWAVSVGSDGEYGDFAYSFEGSTFSTENDRPNNDFEQYSGALRLDYALNETWAIGTTFRVYDQTYGSPNSRFSPNLEAEETETAYLTTLFAKGSYDAFNLSLVGGFQDKQFVSIDPNAFGDIRTDIDNRRWVLDAQVDWTVGSHTFVSGVNLDNSENFSSGFGAIDEEQTYWAVFLQDIWEVSEQWRVIGGLRLDDFDTFGSEITWKLGSIYALAEDSVLIRANVGTGFRAPGFIDLYADSSFFVGNPDLSPERSLGWDIGFTVFGFDEAASLTVTYFRNELEDLITSDFSSFPGTSINIAEARTQGIEIAVDYDTKQWGVVSANYTWLEAKDLTSDTRLLRRPEHTVGFGYTLDWDAWSFNVSGNWVLKREDIDAETFLTIDGEDYFTTDLAVEYSLNEFLTLRASANNVFDEEYETAHGFPTLGRGIFGQIVIDFE